ncbi:MAG TPA: GNAT family N-acetyltransferase [Streptosporangiaceae bacterium]|nr:GNAT family N-acetyltransferase [Streptosporangiaceae bacterium]
MRLIAATDLTSPAWSGLWAADACRHPMYQPAELRAGMGRRPSLYYLPAQLRPAAAGRAGGEFSPAHLVAADADGPVMGVVMTIERNGGQTYLSSFGRPLYIAADATAGPLRRRAAARLLHDRLEELRCEHGAQGYHFRDFLTGGHQSELTELVLRAGGQALPYFVQLIDLSRPLDEISGGFRKSLRYLLRHHRDGYSAEVVTAGDVTGEHVKAFHGLHVGAFGETRPWAAWEAMGDCVRSGEAFWVFGCQDGEFVSAGYFPCSDICCCYASAANDRAQYGAGLSHLVLWRAIEHAQQQGCRSLELGERLYPGQHAGLDAKFHSIAHFKAGFGGDVAVRLDVFSAGAAGPT